MKLKKESRYEVEDFRARLKKEQSIFDETVKIFGHKDPEHEGNMAELEYREAVNGLLDAGLEPLNDEHVEAYRKDYKQEFNNKRRFAGWLNNTLGENAWVWQMVAFWVIFAITFISVFIHEVKAEGDNGGPVVVLFFIGVAFGFLTNRLIGRGGEWGDTSLKRLIVPIPSEMKPLAIKAYRALHPVSDEPEQLELVAKDGEDGNKDGDDEQDESEFDLSTGIYYFYDDRKKNYWNVILKVDLPLGRTVYVKHLEATKLI